MNKFKCKNVLAIQKHKYSNLDVSELSLFLLISIPKFTAGYRLAFAFLFVVKF